MPREKVFASCAAAVADIPDGSTVLISGFADFGFPRGLVNALGASGVGGLTVISCDGAVPGPSPKISRLVANGQVSKLISPMPFPPGSGGVIEERWRAGRLELEVVPQGVLVERLRAGGAGLGGVFLPTSVGTRFEQDREKRTFPRGEAVLELPLKADYALIEVRVADTLGNAVYNASARNSAPVMAMAARVTIAEAGRIVEPGALDPEAIISPGIFVNRVVERLSARPVQAVPRE